MSAETSKLDLRAQDHQRSTAGSPPDRRVCWPLRGIPEPDGISGLSPTTAAHRRRSLPALLLDATPGAEDSRCDLGASPISGCLDRMRTTSDIGSSNLNAPYRGPQTAPPSFPSARSERSHGGARCDTSRRRPGLRSMQSALCHTRRIEGRSPGADGVFRVGVASAADGRAVSDRAPECA